MIVKKRCVVRDRLHVVQVHLRLLHYAHEFLLINLFSWDSQLEQSVPTLSCVPILYPRSLFQFLSKAVEAGARSREPSFCEKGSNRRVDTRRRRLTRVWALICLQPCRASLCCLRLARIGVQISYFSGD